MKKEIRIGNDNICPITKEVCSDECCPPGAICNISGEDVIDARQAKEWVDISQWPDKIDTALVIMLFNNGETCPYRQDYWPFAKATHFYILPSPPVK